MHIFGSSSNTATRGLVIAMTMSGREDGGYYTLVKYCAAQNALPLATVFSLFGNKLLHADTEPFSGAHKIGQ